MKDSITIGLLIGSTLNDSSGKYFYNKNVNAYYKKIETISNQPEWMQSSFATIELNEDDSAGIYKEFYKSGKIHFEIPFIIEDEYYLAHGIEKVYYDGYDDVSQSFVYILHKENHIEKGLRIGTQKQYYTNGNLMYESFSESDGISVNQKFYKKYHLNGNLSEEVYPDWGKKYYESGELLATWKGQDFKIIGEYIEKYPNGSLKMKVNYIDGHRHGIMYKYFENGTLKELWNYKNGERNSIKKYYPDGKIKSEWFYNKGRLEKKIEFDKNGNIKLNKGK